MNKKMLALLLFLQGHDLMAQIPPEDTVIPVMSNFPQFFVCLLAGVLLAMGFQVFLTTLSVASGISLIGNVEERKEDREGTEGVETREAKDQDTISPIVKITSTFGVWTILTVSLSLFFASLLAVKLSLVENDYIGVTLGLVIWATFFSVMTYLELRSVTSLLGGIFNTALQGLRSSFGVVGRMMGFSAEGQAKGMAQSAISGIRDELAETFDFTDFKDKIQDYVEKLQPPELDYGKIKRELADLLGHIELQERVEVGPYGPEKRTLLRVVQDHGHFSRREMDRLAREFSEDDGFLHSKAHRGGPGPGPGMGVPPEERFNQYNQRFENYFMTTDKAKLNMENIKRDMETIFDDPHSMRDVLQQRLHQFNQSSLSQMLGKRADLKPEEIEAISGYAAQAINAFKEKLAGLKEKVQGTPQDPRDGRMSDMKDVVSQKMEQDVRSYLNNLNRPELNYERIKRDFERILHDPKSTVSVLKDRMDQLDRNTLIALLSSNEHISQRDAERMVDKIEEAKQTVLRKKEDMENLMRRKSEDAKREALHQAENIRKGAMSASWWLFATALFSGVAAGLGGLLA